MLQIKSNIYSCGEYFRYMAFQDGKFAYIGNERMKNAKTIDFSRQFIYPGFIDSHTHLLWYGLNLVRCSLFGVKSEDEIYARIEDYSAKNPKREYIIAEGFDETAFSKKGFPSKKTLDSMFGDIPVVVRRVCGHIAVLNTEAEKLLKKHLGGDYDENTGIAREGIILSLNTIFKPKKAEKILAMKAAQRMFFSLGITSIGDMATFDSFDIYNTASLNLDVFFYYPAKNAEKLSGWKDSKNVKLKGLKLFTDGSIGGYTAAVSLPYRGKKSFGALELTEAEFKSAVKIAGRNNYQLAVHAIGDRAIAFALKNLLKRKHDRIEHFELASAEQIHQAKKQKIFLSMQPNFIGNWSMDGQMYEERLDKKYYRFNNSVRTIAEENIPMGFGSDCMPPSPLYGIASLRNANFKNQRLSPIESLKYYTEGSSEIMFEEKTIGKIQKNYIADFTVLSGRIEDAGKKRLDVVSVFKRGKQVFTKE